LIFFIGFFAVALLISFIIIWFHKWFNRDPERYPPKKDKVIVSPADGKIIYINYFEPGSMPVITKFSKKINSKDLIDNKVFLKGGYIIGIYLSPFDIHVTRAPVSGKVIFIKRNIGQISSKELFKFRYAEESSACILKGDGINVGIIQMAAYIVRRVLLYLEKNEEVRIGQRLGRIKMGSQVDLILSNGPGINIIVKPGDKIRAGETIVAILCSGRD
jgi:phosphatidylserine decarboxylase